MPVFVFYENYRVLGYSKSQSNGLGTGQSAGMSLDMFQIAAFMREPRRMSEFFHSTKQHVQG